MLGGKEGRREGGKLKEILLLSVTLYHANTNFWEGEDVIVVNQQKYIADTIGGSLRLLTNSPVTAESAGLYISVDKRKSLSVDH